MQPEPTQHQTPSLLERGHTALLFVSLNAAFQFGLYLRQDVRFGALTSSPPDTMTRLTGLAFALGLVLLPACLFWGGRLAELCLTRALPGKLSLLSLMLPLTLVGEALLGPLILADNRVYDTVGVHLYSEVVLHAVSGQGADRELHLVGPSTTSAIFLLATFLFVEGLLYLALWSAHRWASAWTHAPSKPLRWVVPGTTLLAAASLLVPMSPNEQQYLTIFPFFSEMRGPEVTNPMPGATHIPNPALDPVKFPPFRSKPDILFFVMESTRGDHFTEELMPNATAFAKRRGCLTSDTHYAGGHTTEYGIFGLLTSVYGLNYEPFSRDNVPPFPIQVLKRQGYQIDGFSSSGIVNWNHGGFLFQDFDTYEELLDVPADDGDPMLVDKIAQILSTRGEKPVFSFLFFNSTHHNYLYPPAFERYTPVVERDYDHFLGDAELADRKEGISNRYKNSVLFVDSLFGQIAPLLREDTIVVLTGDHGEEFWEHGLLGHGAPRFEEERVRVPLMLCLPSKPKDPGLTAHVDLWPTIFDELGGLPTPLDAWSDGRSMVEPYDGSPLFIDGLDFPWDHGTMAVVDPNFKAWMRLCTGELCLEPFRTTSRLDEERSLSPEEYERLERHLEQWRSRAERFVDFVWE